MDTGIYKRLHAKENYGPLLEKDIRTILKRELLTNFGFDNMGAIADLLIDRFLTIIQEHTTTKDQIQPYQTIILAVDKKQRRGKSKTMAMTKLKPVLINLMTIEERQRLANGESIRNIRPDMAVRIMNEVDVQGATVAYNDVAMVTGYTIGGVAGLKKDYLKKHPDAYVPHAGTVFDMGNTLTHKKQIITEYLKCLLTKDIAEKTKHHTSNVDKYISDFNRILELYEEGKEENQIVFLTKLSRSLVKEHIKLINEFIDKKKLIATKK
jgi:hypothetical protein